MAMAETNQNPNPTPGNGGLPAAAPGGAASPSSNVAAPSGGGDKFVVNLPGGSAQEAKKTSAVSFLQKLISKTSGEAPHIQAEGSSGLGTGVPSGAVGASINPPSQAPGALAGAMAPKPPPEASTEENLFTKLFGKKTLTTGPTGLPQRPSQPSPLARLPALPKLGKAPVFDEAAEERKVRRAKTIFFIVFLFTVLGLAFLFLQLKPDIEILGKTVAKKFDETNQAVIAKQTQINEARFRLAAFHISRVNVLSDSYQYNQNVAFVSTNSVEKAQAQIKMNSLRDEIITSLSLVKKALEPKLSVALFTVADVSPTDLEKQFEDALVASIQTQKSATQDPQEIQTLNAISDFVSNRTFRGFLRNLKTEGLDAAGLDQALREIRERSSDVLSQLHTVRQKRIKWTEIIDRIDNLTRQVDKVYGQGLFEEIGGIRYTNYDFNTGTGQVSLTGQVKTDDSKTFTLLANLIDTLEKSPYFKGIEMRDFAKSKGEGGFTSSLRLQFFLETPSDKSTPPQSQ